MILGGDMCQLTRRREAKGGPSELAISFINAEGQFPPAIFT